MSTFTDSKNRTWHIEFTVWDMVRRIPRTTEEIIGTKISLMHLEQKMMQGKNFDDLYLQILSDPELFVDLLYCILKPQLDEADVGAEDFGQSLGPAAYKAAHVAFQDSLHDFFLQAGMDPAAELVGNMRKVIGDWRGKIGSKINSESENLIQRVQDEIESMSFSRPPEPSESTPSP